MKEVNLIKKGNSYYLSIEIEKYGIKKNENTKLFTINSNKTFTPTIALTSLISLLPETGFKRKEICSLHLNESSKITSYTTLFSKFKSKGFLDYNKEEGRGVYKLDDKVKNFFNEFLNNIDLKKNDEFFSYFFIQQSLIKSYFKNFIKDNNKVKETDKLFDKEEDEIKLYKIENYYKDLYDLYSFDKKERNFNLYYKYNYKFKKSSKKNLFLLLKYLQAKNIKKEEESLLTFKTNLSIDKIKEITEIYKSKRGLNIDIEEIFNNNNLNKNTVVAELDIL